MLCAARRPREVANADYCPTKLVGALIWMASPKSERVVVDFSTANRDACEMVTFWVACVRTIRPARSSHTDRTKGAVSMCSLYGWFFEFVSAIVFVEPGIGTRYLVAG